MGTASPNSVRAARLVGEDRGGVLAMRGDEERAGGEDAFQRIRIVDQHIAPVEAPMKTLTPQALVTSTALMASRLSLVAPK